MYRDWYKNWFGEKYLQVYAHRDGEDADEMINFILRHISLQSDLRILDLCCGNGRHSKALSLAGFNVFGLDLSEQLLAEARSQAINPKQLKLVRGDMRQLPFFECFDVILNLFTSFGYFTSDEENRSVFQQFNNALKPHGKYVFDYLNPGYVESTLVPYDSNQIGNIRIEQERFIENSRVIKHIQLKDGETKHQFHESVKLYQLEDILEMMRSCGLRPLEIFGDRAGNEYNEKSTRMIIIGEKIGTKNN